MVEFKVVVSDPKNGKSYKAEISGHHANLLIGKKIGDEIDGVFVGLPSYKLTITGGSDRDGFPMKRSLPGTRRTKILMTRSVGCKEIELGVRKKKSIRGNILSPDIIQINMKITTQGAKSIEELLKPKEEKK